MVVLRASGSRQLHKAPAMQIKQAPKKYIYIYIVQPRFNVEMIWLEERREN